MRKKAFLSALVICAFSMPAIASLLVPGTVVGSYTINSVEASIASPFYAVGSSSPSATVTSTVYLTTSNDYLYAYQISDATVKFSYFTVSWTQPSVTIDASSWITAGAEIAPMAWDLSDTGQEMEALFSGNLKTPNSSALLWFVTSDAPASTATADAGALIKYSAAGPTVATGSVFVPIPEPLTMLLLGSGWMMMRTCNRKK